MSVSTMDQAHYGVPQEMVDWPAGASHPTIAEPAKLTIPGTDIPIITGPSLLPMPGQKDATSGGFKNPLDTLSGLGGILAKLSDVKFWIRVGQMALGVLLVLVGIWLMVSESNAGQKLKSQAESAAVVAAAA